MKKIPISRLKIGMYVADVNIEWINHPFFTNKFLVKNDLMIRKLINAGVKELYIDPSKGLDAEEAPTDVEIRNKIMADMADIVSEKRPAARNVAADRSEGEITVHEEINKAKKIYGEATQIVHNIMRDVRLGKQVKVEEVSPFVEEISDSIVRCPDAILSLLRVKNKDDYTFQHSVSICALQVAFSKAVGMSDADVYQAGIGGLLHDIGKIMIDDRILNKPDKLTDGEFIVMKNHVLEGRKILDSVTGISSIAKQVAYEHHERYDGTGYPYGLKGENISKIGRMAAICDVYDALTSNRVYHKGMNPTDALGKILEWSSFHFDRTLAEQFIKVIGIYPVGTLVQLESGLVGVVVEQHNDDFLHPIVNIFYNSKYNKYTKPERVDLSKKIGSDEIIGPATPDGFDVNPLTLL